MTPRETECYALMKEGKTGAQIALAMGLTPQSGKMMRKRVNRHLSLEERDHLANLAANACYTRLKPRPRPIWRWEPA